MGYPGRLRAGHLRRGLGLDRRVGTRRQLVVRTATCRPDERRRLLHHRLLEPRAGRAGPRRGRPGLVGRRPVPEQRPAVLLLPGRHLDGRPHVAGIVALMLEDNPALTASEAESILESTALPIGPGCRDVAEPTGTTSRSAGALTPLAPGSSDRRRGGCGPLIPCFRRCRRPKSLPSETPGGPGVSACPTGHPGHAAGYTDRMPDTAAGPAPSATTQAADQPRPGFRLERDPLGPLEVPEDAYYGVQTQRAIRNFPISGRRPDVGARARRRSRSRRPPRAPTTRPAGCPTTSPRPSSRPPTRSSACAPDADAPEARAPAGARSIDNFRVDPFQAGAGVSHNMNTNEVLANRAIEILGAQGIGSGQRGDYSVVSPNDHVNMAQSTNDVFPTVDARRHARPDPRLPAGARRAGRRLRRSAAAPSTTSSSPAARTCRTPCPSGSARSSPPTR